MFAVIKTGGKQYRVADGDTFTIERLPGASGDSVTFGEVLMVGTSIGAPFVSGASVVAEIVDQVRGPKVISFKKRRRQNSKRSRGHRQDLTLVRISEILTDGRQPSERKAATAETATVSETETTPATEKPKRAAKKVDATEGAAEAPKKPRASKKKDEAADEA